MTQRERDTIIHLVAGGAIQWIPTCSLLVSLIDGTRKTISENCFQPAGTQYSNTPDGQYCGSPNVSTNQQQYYISGLLHFEWENDFQIASHHFQSDQILVFAGINAVPLGRRTAGTVGAVLTCPLEVVKTRLQSSSSFVSPPRLPEAPGCTNTSEALLRPEQRRKLCTTILRKRPQPQIMAISHCGISSTVKSMSIVQCLKHIVQNEGPRALFKGLGPNLVGVAPSRAIYFCTYSQTKSMLNSIGFIRPDSPMVHILSASCAGFAASSATNPIWFVKTRLQLDYNSKVQMTVRECIGRIYAQGGLLGFYKGITASYVGISETVVHFVIYEAIKSKLVELHGTNHPGDLKTSRDFLEFMLAGATSKTIASCIAYPHEVARTRLREEGNKYNKFWQTLHTVWKEEGRAGLYRGLATQLVRQIPNTAIMMATYEAVVYVLTRRFNSGFLDAEEQPRICDLVDL